MSSKPLAAEKVLAIATELHKYQGRDKFTMGMASEISHATHSNSSQIKIVNRMIKDGLIAYQEDGTPYFVTPFESIQKHYLKIEKKGAKQIADKAVVDTVQGEIRDEAIASTEQYIILGKAVWQAISQWAARRGITPDELRKMPVHKLVLEALENADKVPGLETENKDLKNQLAVLLDETDPVIRLKKAIQLLNKFLIAATIAEEIGLNIDSIIPTYENLIKGYITGAPNA